MKSMFLACIIVISFHVSYQIQCSDYNIYPKCGYHDTDYQLTCHKFTSICEEVEVDDGCEINASNVCTKKTVPDNEDCINFYGNGYDERNHVCKRVKIDNDCKVEGIGDYKFQCTEKTTLAKDKCVFSEDYKNCKKTPKVCSDYSDSDCGGITIDEGKKIQCVKPQSGNCVEIQIDEKCMMEKESNYKCIKRENIDFNDTLYRCDYNSYQRACRYTKIPCNERTDTTKCRDYPNCYKVSISKYAQACQEVSIDPECKINDNGDCTHKDDTFDTVIKECRFNETQFDFSSSYPIGCKVFNKQCIQIKDTSKCANGITQEGYSCKKIDGENDKCMEVRIHPSCNINNDGKCVGTSGNKCQFDSKKNCVLYDDKCQIKTDDSCSYSGDDGTKICEFEGIEKMYCKIRDKKCEDYTTESSCEADTVIGVQDRTKCSWSNYHCREYGIDSVCKVKKGNCEGTPTKDNYVCHFDITGHNCYETEKKCTNYYGNECHSVFPVGASEKTQCFNYNDTKNCKLITIDDFCNVNENNLCVQRKDFAQKEGICSFDDNKDKCTRITRKCIQYTDDSCNTEVQSCAYDTIYKKCYDIDSYCTMKDGECKEKDTNNIPAGKKCRLNSFTQECKIDDMRCNEYKNDQCNTYPQTANKQCIKRENSCVLIELDGNCKVNDTDYCVPVDSNKISDHEICAFSDTSRTECLKREKICSDIENDKCETYKPITKLCYNIDSKGCQQVRVDSQCKMNDENKCTGSGCSLKRDDDNIYHCSYTEDKGGDSSFEHFVQLKRFMLLILVLML